MRHEDSGGWFDSVARSDAGGALEAIADSVDASRKAFKAMMKAFRMPEPVELPELLQMPLPLFVAWFPMSMRHAA